MDIIDIGIAKKLSGTASSAALNATLDYTPVTEATNAFACAIGSAKIKRFSFAIADVAAKTVTFSGVPTGRCEVELEITTSAVGSVTWTLNSGSSLKWADEVAPILESGKVYLVMLRTSDSGVNWIGYASRGV